MLAKVREKNLFRRILNASIDSQRIYWGTMAREDYHNLLHARWIEEHWSKKRKFKGCILQTILWTRVILRAIPPQLYCTKAPTNYKQAKHQLPTKHQQHRSHPPQKNITRKQKSNLIQNFQLRVSNIKAPQKMQREQHTRQETDDFTLHPKKPKKMTFSHTSNTTRPALTHVQKEVCETRRMH